MSHLILLISADPALAQRVRLALPSDAPIELHCAAADQPAPDRRGWLLILADARAVAESLFSAAASAPLIWLADPPLAATAPFRAGVIDCLDRNEKLSKLSFVLSQHLETAYARRLRSRMSRAARRPLDPAEEQRALANLLTGILGNAELALGAASRLPVPLRARLQRILLLSAALRDLLVVSDLPSPERLPAVSPTLRAA